MRRHAGWSLLLIASLLLAGCAAPATGSDPRATAPFDAYEAPGAVETLDEDGARTFRFEGVSPAGAREPLGQAPQAREVHAFDAGELAAFIEVRLEHDGPGALDAVLRDPWGRIQCSAIVGSVDVDTGNATRRCTAPVPANLTEAARWQVDVGPGAPAAPPDTPYVLLVTLHGHERLQRADGVTGADMDIRFHVADTGVPGFEPTVGVLADGTIFVQEHLRTMRSRDEGRSWQDATPTPEPPTTADPMMRADPWTGRVYVNHLYVACSALWWSEDAGDTWTTNPASCGLPVNDHQKIAVGPSPVAASDLPVLYYSWYSFQGFVWVARSLDGGFTFTTAPVFTPADGQPVNTGPVEADREGGVFVPTYFCDDGGWIGIGVSHDHGATFRTVRVSEEDGPCDQVDPSIAIDAAGTIYLAFVRPTGVKVATSHDRGLTWSEPYDVSLPSLRSFLHVDAVAGDAGHIAIAYRGTADGQGGPKGVDGWAAWRLYASFVNAGDTPTPSVTHAVVGGPDEIVYRGALCLGFYPPCPDGERTIGEFIDTALTPDGRLVVAYDDGCADACPTPADSRHAIGAVAVLEEGPRLYTTRAPWAE